MTPLEISGAADADLDEILSYSSLRFGDAIAAEYFFSFDESFELLQRHPFAGELDEEAGPDVRRIHHRSHRIFYEVSGGRIRVLRILHHSMAIDGKFDQF